MMSLLSMTTDVQVAFLPPLLWIVGGLFGLGGLLIASISTEATEGTKLGVIGMKGAGKTTYLLHLGLVSDDGGTSVTPYEGKKTQVPGCREMYIAAGEDIGGEDEFMRFYEPWLVGKKKKDIILFIFDGYRYLNNKKYRNNAISRLRFIHEKYKQGNIDTKEYKNIVLVASHFDEYDKNKSVDDMRKEILEITGKQDFLDMFKNNFFAVDLRKTDMVADMNLEIFPES